MRTTATLPPSPSSSTAAAANHEDFIYLFLGPVIGCGIALEGDCLRGVTGNAGDIAVMPVTPSRLPSAPPPEGEWGLLLSRVSLNALARHLRYCGETVGTHAALNRLSRQGHPARRGMADDCIAALTRPCARRCASSMYHWCHRCRQWTPA